MDLFGHDSIFFVSTTDIVAKSEDEFNVEAQIINLNSLGDVSMKSDRSIQFIAGSEFNMEASEVHISGDEGVDFESADSEVEVISWKGTLLALPWRLCA